MNSHELADFDMHRDLVRVYGEGAEEAEQTGDHALAAVLYRRAFDALEAAMSQLVGQTLGEADDAA